MRMALKNCRSCGAPFEAVRNQKDCPECFDPTQKRNMHRVRLRLRYGMTPEQYDELIEKQGGRCAVCGTAHPVKGSSNRGWHVDHDHVTGKVRGLLCNSCNRGIGLLQDNPELLEKAAAYLRFT